jgi:hypothetical protein
MPLHTEFSVVQNSVITALMLGSSTCLYATSLYVTESYSAVCATTSPATTPSTAVTPFASWQQGLSALCVVVWLCAFLFLIFLVIRMVSRYEKRIFAEPLWVKFMWSLSLCVLLLSTLQSVVVYTFLQDPITWFEKEWAQTDPHITVPGGSFRLRGPLGNTLQAMSATGLVLECLLVWAMVHFEGWNLEHHHPF